MTSFRSIFVLLLVCIFCWQCKQSDNVKIVKVNGYDVINCDLTTVKDTIKLKLSDFIDNCEIVRIETNENSLIGGVRYISISDNYLLIYSNNQPVKLFDRKGKFIRNIGSIGNGPGEYNSLYGIQLDEPSGRIYLTPLVRSNLILAYNLDGSFIKDIPLVHPITKSITHIAGDVVTVLSMSVTNKIPVAYQQTTEGKLIHQLPEIKHLIVSDYNGEISSSRNNGKYDYFNIGGKDPDTLFRYENNKMIPEFVITAGGLTISPWIRSLKNHYWAVFFDEYYRGKTLLVNKKTLKAEFFNGIKNDFLGNIPVSSFYLSNDGYFVSSTTAISLISDIDKALKENSLNESNKTKLESLGKQINENDNNILFLGKFK